VINNANINTRNFSQSPRQKFISSSKLFLLLSQFAEFL